MTDNIAMRADSTALAVVFAQPAWLAEHLDDPDVRVVEVDVSRAAYDQGHIPNSILWHAYADLHHAQDYSPLERSEFEELLRRSGFTSATTIVFYGYGPYLGFWLTKAYGHQRGLVLNGTRQDWREADLPWTTALPELVPSTYTLPVAEVTQLIELQALQAALGSGDPLILDVRSQAEFVGERFWPSGATAGGRPPRHTPRAIHLPTNPSHTAQCVYPSATP